MGRGMVLVVSPLIGEELTLPSSHNDTYAAGVGGRDDMRLLQKMIAVERKKESPYTMPGI